MTEVTGVWWDEGWKHYGWTCQRCRYSGINHQSVDSARFSFAAHHCPRQLDAEPNGPYPSSALPSDGA